MSQPGLNTVNEHLEDNELLTIDGFCEAACEVFADHNAHHETVRTFKADPLEPSHLNDVRHLLRNYANTRDSELAKRLVIWCDMFPQIVKEVS